MPVLFKDNLHTQLLQYKKAGPTARQAIIDEINQSIDTLPEKIMTKAQAAEAYKTLVHAATRLNYAKALQNPLTPAFGNFDDTLIGQILPTEKGQYNFAPGSGNEALTLADCRLQRSFTENSELQNILDAYLVAEHGQLFETAKKYYDTTNPDIKMERDVFITALENCLSEDLKFPIDGLEADGLGLEQLRKDLKAPLEAAKTNTDTLPSDVLKDMIEILKRFGPNGDALAQAAQRKLLNELKARFQIDTFKLLPMYNEILDQIKPLITTIKVENFFDLPNDIGTQTYSVISMKRSFDDLFRTFIELPESKLETDLQGRTIQRLTLLGALAKPVSIKSSDLLIVLASQLDHLKAAASKLSDVWLLNEYNTARSALKVTADSIKNLETDVEKTRQLELTQAFENLDIAFKAKDTAHQAALETLLIQLKEEVKTLNDSGQESTQTLINNLNNTTQLLNNTMTTKDYETTTTAMQGHAWSSLNSLRNIMLGLSLAVVTLGVIAVATPIIAAVTIPVATALTAFGLFMMNRPTGLSKAAIDLNAEAAKLAAIHTPAPGQTV